MYQDRHDAALQLASRLGAYRGQHPLVLGIPRGGVPMAHCIANALEGELDVVMAQKMAHPLLPEYAIGAVNEGGWTYYSPFADTLIRSPLELDVEKLHQLDLIRQRRAQYTPTREPLEIRGRLVIVVDDGVATGATMVAALQEVRSRLPRKLVCAVPVASHESLRQIRPWVDELVCLQAPAQLEAISLHYRQFAPVSDAEVVRCLQASCRPAQKSQQKPPHAPQQEPQQEPQHEPQTTRVS